MLAHNTKMQQLLKKYGIDCVPKRADKGSMRGTWRLYSRSRKELWSDSLRESLTLLGFLDYDRKPLGKYSGNGGYFQVFVIAPKEIEDLTKETARP